MKKRKKYKSRKHAHHLETYIKGYPGGAMVIPDDDSVLEIYGEITTKPKRRKKCKIKLNA